MTLFNAKDAVENVTEARTARKADKPVKLDRFAQMAADNKTLREENAHLGAKVSQLESRIASLESRADGTEQWQAEAQKHVQKIEKDVSGTKGRQCPECEEVYPDGVVHWPGYESKTHPGDPRCFNCFPQAGA